MSPPQQSRDAPSTANGPPMEFITMSQGAFSRLQAAQRVVDGHESGGGCCMPGLSARQVKRLTRRLRSEGAASSASPRRSRPPNNAFDPPTRARVLALAQAAYVGFGPTFLAEKLAERDELAISRKTMRQWLIAAQLHRPRRRRHQPRPLRERPSGFTRTRHRGGTSRHRQCRDCN